MCMPVVQETKAQCPGYRPVSDLAKPPVAPPMGAMTDLAMLREFVADPPGGLYRYDAWLAEWAGASAISQ